MLFRTLLKRRAAMACRVLANSLLGAQKASKDRERKPLLVVVVYVVRLLVLVVVVVEVVGMAF